jgi:hypothetical protein
VPNLSAVDLPSSFEMHRSPTGLIMIAGSLAVAGLLAGCGGGDDDAEPTVPATLSVETTRPDVTGSSTPATEPPSTDAPVETDAPATDPPATDAPAPDDEDCLIGNWVVTEEQMDAYYAGLMSTMDAPLTMDTEGSAPLSFDADGTYAWAPDFALVVEVAGQGGTGDVGGTITGRWAAADGVVTTSSEVNALTVSIAVNEIVFDGADLANGMLNSSPVNGVTYSCDGPTPVLDFKTADDAVTVPVTLEPA